MQVNFNPSVNYSRPSFKASFSDDINTKSVIKSFAHSDFGSLDILTAHLALKDIDSDDKIKLYYEDHYNKTLYAENSKGKKIIMVVAVSILSIILVLWGGLNLLKFALYSDYYKAKELLSQNMDKGFIVTNADDPRTAFLGYKKRNDVKVHYYGIEVDDIHDFFDNNSLAL